MTFIDAAKTGFAKYATFAGRASRSEFWYWTLFSFLANIVASLIDAVLGLGILSFVVSLGLVIPGTAVSVRRLHDLDRTGWWLLLMFTGIGIILLIVWDCFKGTASPNRFGPDPL
jgi:uncharacterized membrane protein YhaH (DUF805 family)